MSAWLVARGNKISARLIYSVVRRSYKIMKEIIFFQEKEPSKEEICKNIEHFCREHCKTCSRIPRKKSLKYRIDGELYHVELSKETSGSPLWMVACISS